MPTQTKFICPSGGVNVDFSGVFEELNGGTAYGSATNFKVGALDLTGYFHASTSAEDRPSFNTGYKIGANDLSTIFRRRGYVNDPVITSQPTAITKTTTQSATFTVQFTCVSVPVTYQWKKDGTNLTGTGSSGTVSSAGANTLSYIINSVAMGNQGNYSITLTGAGVVNSSNARLSISPRIISTGDPAGPYTLYYGSTNSQVLNLQITNADGETPLSYQWYKNSSTLGSGSGAQTSQYTKTIANGDSGTYTCIVTNAYGTATTGNFVITALSGVPTISSHPSNQIVNNNTIATFSVSASANGAALSYQWKKDNVDIEGETSNAYSISNTTTSNDGSYTCFISTIYGSITSNAAISRIKPYITTQPLGASLNETDGVSLSVTAAGSPILYYQWRKNGTDISGATSSSYPSSGQFALNLSTVGTYTCKVTSTHDSTGVISSGAVLTIIPPTITSISPNTGSYNYNDGDGITFIVTATATNLTYSFYRGVTLVQSGTSNQYAFSVSETNNGTYKCTVSNNGGSVDSAPVTIVRFYQNSITAQPTNQTAIVNGSNDATFSISANGNAVPTYQWQENDGGWSNLSNGARVSGATSSQLSILNVESGDNGRLFRCVVSNKKANGSDNWNDTTSTQVSLTTYWVTITSQPSGVTVDVDDPVTMSVTVSANPYPPTYRWQYSSDDSNWTDTFNYEYSNGSGTDTDTMAFTATGSDTGYYRCKITNASGTVYSNSAYVSVN